MINLHRRAGWLITAAAAGAAALAVSGVAVAGAVSGPGRNATRQASTSLTYACRFPSGTRQVGVQVTAGFPVTATVGRAIQPTGVHITITVPRPALRGLGGAGATAVRGRASLGVTTTEDRTSASTAWQVATARPVRMPTTGSLVLAASGAVPPTTASAPGEVVFTADGLLLALGPGHTADTAASLATAVACGLSPGQDARLATVPVSGRSLSSTPFGRSRTAGAHCTYYRSIVGLIGSAYLAGFSDVNKLNEAALIGPGPDDNPRAALADLYVAEGLFDSCTNQLYEYTYGHLDYLGKSQFPPAVGTFLSFRFMPITATLIISLVPIECRDLTGHLVGKGTLCIVSIPTVSVQVPNTATSYLRIRVEKAAVNGVPLNLGPDCHTAYPTKSVLKGTYPIANGGTLSGYVTIPPFTGCGVGENLDPLLNASVSGPKNFTIITQGPACLKSTKPGGTTNGNCLIKPGAPGYPYGLPKYYPKVQR